MPSGSDSELVSWFPCRVEIRVLLSKRFFCNVHFVPRSKTDSIQWKSSMTFIQGNRWIERKKERLEECTLALSMDLHFYHYIYTYLWHERTAWWPSMIDRLSTIDYPYSIFSQNTCISHSIEHYLSIMLPSIQNLRKQNREVYHY